MAIQREYLSPNDIAEYLGVSPFTIRRYIKLGELRAVKLLGGFRVHRADLQAFLKAHEVNPAEEALESGEVHDESPRVASAPPAPPGRAADVSPLLVRATPPYPPAPLPIPEIAVKRKRGRPRKNPLPM